MSTPTPQATSPDAKDVPALIAIETVPVGKAPRDESLHGQSAVFGDNTVAFDAAGRAHVTVPVALAVLECPGFALCDPADQAVLDTATDSGIEVGKVQGEQAGEPVQITVKGEDGTPVFVNETIVAPDNREVAFNAKGVASCGHNTANELKTVYPHSTIRKTDAKGQFVKA
jgi:hypothetical protein